ncbi:hypothetical protein E8E13_009257 [Curvularia kusanoi]|uniref:Uncharacterized protein n=1 Tax=Curvularia kusanoi TaxID=90978 RepID=A0A9P4TD16_CURKU|nr:hypothetical protein E8E13_009257 [Curvularia kusanoi]
MEPPAKRLRILQSVEVDETNPEYIEAKQKQQQKFKSRLERIFDKYANMHESMSDEIDFKTGKLVVDRGHIRRVQRQMQRKGPSLVDNLLEPALDQDRDSEGEEEQVESEDELAPTQAAKKERNLEEKEGTAQPSWQQSTPAIAKTPRVVSSALPQVAQIPRTPNQTTDLYQQIQQTSLDQQTQAALVANLNQIQAAQQALASLLNILQGTPNGQTPQASYAAFTPQVSAIDNVRPAADPKWYFPPISAVKEAPSIGHRSSPPRIDQAREQIECPSVPSSPPVPRRKSPRVQIQKRRNTTGRNHGRQVSEEKLSSLQTRAVTENTTTLRINEDTTSTATPTRKGRRVRPSTAYTFTDEDYIYISERVDTMTLVDIKASQKKWSGWPKSTFYNRWQACRKDRQLHSKKPPKTDKTASQTAPSPLDQEEHFFSSVEIPETSSAEHRLPTPNSLEQDNQVERAVIPSSSHFDDDELELLSLAGVDSDDNDRLRLHSYHGDEDYPTPDEPLPSIEGAEFRNEDDLQYEMLKAEQSPTPQPPALPSTIPETQESLVVASPPRQHHRRPFAPPAPLKPTKRAVSADNDSDQDIDLIASHSDFAPPTTPRVTTLIKREPLSSPRTLPPAPAFASATALLCSSSPLVKLRTPANRIQHPPSSEAAAKSTGSLNRRAYLNDVKKSWAKGKGRTGREGGKKRGFRTSLDSGFVLEKVGGVKRKRGDAEGESEDELAL